MPTQTDGTVTWRELLGECSERLTVCGIDSASQEARWIVEEASGNTGRSYIECLDQLCTERGVAHFDAMVARREAGEPIQYVLGHWAFRTLDLLVDRRVLIPRPETEVLVGVALEELERQRSGEPLLAADLGTGSGAVALSIAAETTDVHTVGVERSTEAMSVARSNLAGLGNPARRVQLVEGSWFEPLTGYEGRFNVMVSNPPYVSTTTTLPRSVKDWEPTQALLSGPTGLDDARHLLDGALRWLVSGGAIVLELGSDHMAEAVSAAETAGLVSVEVVDDMAGLPRVLRGRRL